jgi:hypothetical protein
LALDDIFVVVRHGTLGTRLDPLNGEPHSPKGPMPLLRQLALGCFQIMTHPSMIPVAAGASRREMRARLGLARAPLWSSMARVTAAASFMMAPG